jgi:hypothetical protein
MLYFQTADRPRRPFHIAAAHASDPVLLQTRKLILPSLTHVMDKSPNEHGEVTVNTRCSRTSHKLRLDIASNMTVCDIRRGHAVA